MKQAWYNENRERFDADTTKVENKISKCDHDWKRITSIEVDCIKCNMRVLDNGKLFPLK